MPEFIQKSEPILERPQRTTEGRILGVTRTGMGVFLSAKFMLNMSFDQLTSMGMNARGGKSIFAQELGSLRPAMKAALAGAVARTYGRSGLRGTGRLLRAAMTEFDVRIEVRGFREIIVIGQWHVNLPYFHRRVFGYVGPDIRGRRFGKGKDTPRPRGYFIKFDSAARREIMMLIDQKVRQFVWRVAGARERELVSVRDRQQSGKRLTAHRVRRTIRKMGADQFEARKLAKEILKSTQPQFLLSELQRLAKTTGFRFVRQTSAPGMKVR